MILSLAAHGSGVLAMNNLTDSQKIILEFLKDFLIQNNCPPTINDIKNSLGLKSYNSAWEYVNRLKKKGYIEERFLSRGVVLKNIKIQVVEDETHSQKQK